MHTHMESLYSGASGTWLEWKCLNRHRTKTGRSKHNMKKWKYIEDDTTTCECKEADHTMDHLLKYPLLHLICFLNYLMVYNEGLCQTMDRIGVVTRQEEESLYKQLVKGYGIPWTSQRCRKGIEQRKSLGFYNGGTTSVSDYHQKTGHIVWYSPVAHS